MKRKLVEPTHKKIPIKRQCDLLGLGRSSYYFTPSKPPPEEIVIRKILYEEFMADPCFGSRRLTAVLRRKGFSINRKKIRRLMAELGLKPIYPKRNLSKPGKGHLKAPYLLGELLVDRPNKAWASDITYVKTEKGFGYLTIIMDLHSRYILSWRLSNTLDAAFCVEALEEAVNRFGAPFLFNMDQGSQYTGRIFQETLEKYNIIPSMDGKGRALDNILVERFWRTTKYEGIYLKSFENLGALKPDLKGWMQYYNEKRIHQSLGYATPREVYFGACQKPQKLAA